MSREIINIRPKQEERKYSPTDNSSEKFIDEYSFLPGKNLKKPNKLEHRIITATDEVKKLSVPIEDEKLEKAVNRGYLRLIIDSVYWDKNVLIPTVQEVEKLVTPEQIADAKRILLKIFTDSLTPEETNKEQYYPYTNIIRSPKLSSGSILILIRRYGLLDGKFKPPSEIELDGLSTGRKYELVVNGLSRLQDNITAYVTIIFPHEWNEKSHKESAIIKPRNKIISTEEFEMIKQKHKRDNELEKMINQLTLTKSTSNLLFRIFIGYSGSFEDLLNILSDEKIIQNFANIGVARVKEITTAVSEYRKRQNINSNK